MTPIAWQPNVVLERIHLQKILLGEAVFEFRAGESIHTENSYKYDVAEFAGRAARCGLRLDATWTDARDYFAVLYLTAVWLGLSSPSSAR